MSTAYFEFHAPTRILAGREALIRMASEMRDRGWSRPLLLSDAGLVRSGVVKQLTQELEKQSQITFCLFSEIPADSSLETIAEAQQNYLAHRADSIIALGGGSVLDTAKALRVALALPQGQSLVSWEGSSNSIPVASVPLFAVPTTAGTGSEVTQAAVISDLQRHQKIPFSSSRLIPEWAVLAPQLTTGLPPLLTAATAMDAITHALEACLGIQRNSFSISLAHTALRSITRSLKTTLHEPLNEESRLDLLVGATAAGMAFSNSMVGLVHALGHAAGSLCHLHHGTAMSIFLPIGLEFQCQALNQEMGDLLLPFAGESLTQQTPPNQRAARLIQEIRALRDELYELTKLPRTLSEAGVSRDCLESIAQASLNDGALAYSATEFTLEEARFCVNAAF